MITKHKLFPPLKTPFSKIDMVDIELFSYCNRQCWFCPNSIIDRHSKCIPMEEKVYLKLLNDLKKVKFHGRMSFNGYSEPTSHKEILIKRLKQAKKTLPNARLIMNTNGDFLTKDYIDDISSAGLEELRIQCYLKEDEELNYETITQRFEAMSRKINLEYKVIYKSPDFYEINFSYDKMLIRMYARDFKVNGNQRGGSLKTIKGEKRSVPCLLPFRNICVGHNGNVMLCCNMHSSLPEHKKFVLGNICENSILDIFNNQKYQDFRKILRNKNLIKNFEPCAQCNFDLGYSYNKDYNPVENLSSKIFSVYNEGGGHNVIRIFGIKFKFKINTNKIILHKENGDIINNPKIKGLKINFCGQYSTVELYEPYNFSNCHITVGDNNYINIKGTKHYINNLQIQHDVSRNNKVLIGENFSCGGARIHLSVTDEITTVKIGDDCMFSWDIVLRVMDGHEIFDINTNEKQNTPQKGITIGSHVFICEQVKILKDCSIADNSIIGLGSLVTKSFDKKNVVIAELPLKSLEMTLIGNGTQIKTINLY